jgi:regulator of sigma E protease
MHLMFEYVIDVVAFVIGLGFLIFAHEAGHFLVAKLFRVRVLVFSLGFGKRLFGFHRGDTDYRVSIFPLGGYVRMAGDTPDESRPGDPAEFLSKPKWQRFLILFAGPGMNLLIAIGVVAAAAMHGTEEVNIKPVVGSVEAKSPAARAGLQPGDRITAINGDQMTEFDDLKLAITVHANSPLRVDYQRNGVARTTTLTPASEETDYGPVGRAGIVPYIEPVIGNVLPNSAAEKFGVHAGDRVVMANGKPVTQFYDLTDAVTKGSAVSLVLQRGALQVPVAFPAAPVDPKDPYRGMYPPSVIRKLSLISAVGYSVDENFKMLKYAGIAIARIFRGEGSVKELSGPVSIARISGDMFRAGLLKFIGLVAMISLQLGVMNLLPIPVLDGGHIFILLIEGAARRDLSMTVKERIQQLGFAVLAALMIVVIYNDVVTNMFRTHTG